MTHNDLVKKATIWLKNTFHCRIVFSELVAYTRSGETPDAIGWVNNKSILIECKTSRSDFFADKKKKARNPNFPALGHWRFFLTPPGLIQDDEIPEDWGLYEVIDKQVRYRGGRKYNHGAHPFKSDRDSEVAMLVSALSRIES